MLRTGDESDCGVASCKDFDNTIIVIGAKRGKGRARGEGSLNDYRTGHMKTAPLGGLYVVRAGAANHH